VLRLRRSDDRPLPARAWVSTRQAGKWLVGAKHTGWKLAGFALLIATILVTFVNVDYRVSAPVQIQPRVSRVVAMPYDGVIASLGAGVEPGAEVHAGDVLAHLDTTETELAAGESRARILQAEREADLARQQHKLSDAQQAEARAEAERARLATAEYRIRAGTITAPIDGRIIEGDLRDKIGASLRLGDGLFKIAPLDDLLVIAQVGDRDIAYIHEGGKGEVATKADPATGYPVTIERIVPLAQPKEGVNAFEVRARLDAPAAGMLPGTEGLAKLSVGRHSLLWIGTRRIRDAARLWLWW
jgi:multidrug resistance efflux pump